MPECPSCRADVSATDDFCGECGTQIEEATVESRSDPEEQLKERVKEKREQEETFTYTKGVLYLLAGLATIPFGYWAGFIGYTQFSGVEIVRVTYPIGGIVAIGMGVLFLIGSGQNFRKAD